MQVIAGVMPELIESVEDVTEAVDDLRGGIELAAVHQRLSNLERFIASEFGTRCVQCEAPGPETASDAIAPCVKRERVGQIRFGPKSDEPLRRQEAQISKIAETVRDGLRFVFVVGNADDGELSAGNRELGLRRAKSVAERLLKEIARTEAGATNAIRINTSSGVGWLPASRSSDYGKAHVYLLWHGRSPLCQSDRPVPLL